MYWRVLWTLPLAATQVWAGPAGAPVSLENLIAQARAANPQLRAARAQWEAATKRPSQEGSLPDPRIAIRDFGVGRPATALNVSDFAFISVGASQEFPYPGKLALRRNVAVEEARAAEDRYRQLELDLLAQVKLRFYEYAYQQRALEVVAEDHDLLLQFLKIAEARYAVGKGIQQDILHAQIQLTALLEREEVFRQQRDSAAAAINALLDRSPDEPLGPAPSIEPSPFPGELADLYKAAQHDSPQLQVKEHEVSRDAAALDLSRKEYKPDFAASFEWQRTGSLFPDYYVVSFEAKIPLYFWRKQRFAVEEAASKLMAARYEHRAETQEILFRIKDQYLMARSAERLASLYKTAIVPQSTLSLESAISAYKVGSVDFLTLINAATLLLDYELEYYKQLTAYQQALARMEPIVGKELIR
jgi:outer membrane protein TolC